MRNTLLASLLVLGACNSAPPAPSDSQNAQVIILEFADATEMAKTLTEFVGNEQTTVRADPRTNSLLVTASQERLPQIKDLIARLDVEVVDPRSR
tara:strand:- start:18698 stop:18982 length:285 start_codon:yes stop_codon:yes gene_type:complete